MENLIWAIGLWALVFVLIPIERLKEIWPVAVVGIIWQFIMNYMMIEGGYYRFNSWIVIIAGVPLFHLIGGAGGSILLLNWMKRNPLYNVILVLFFSGLLLLSESIMIRYGAFQYTNGFNSFLSYLQNVAGLSILVWLSLALVGQEKIHGGNKTRFFRKLPFTGE
ncbi:MAG: hypothetical protein JL50_05325 [Peptococcaceae bacterium BICA1-7]|nr:MAG: hypothetical protein JL50_05325 [Peptococcaceae bacterium BICA1-7]HBV96032.1 hypothetical protein [Desulfotomaculum sp.]